MVLCKARSAGPGSLAFVGSLWTKLPDVASLLNPVYQLDSRPKPKIVIVRQELAVVQAEQCWKGLKNATKKKSCLSCCRIIPPQKGKKCQFGFLDQIEASGVTDGDDGLFTAYFWTLEDSQKELKAGWFCRIISLQKLQRRWEIGESKKGGN